MNKRSEPSFGRWIELGSTTTRERWDEKGSFNHPMFGGGLVWFYRNLAGMQTDPEEPGYRHIIYRPQPVNELEYVTYTNNTSYGKAGISWTKKENMFSMEVQVPVGCCATVYVPAGANDRVKEGERSVSKLPDIEFSGMENGYAVYEVNSGKYSFNVN